MSSLKRLDSSLLESKKLADAFSPPNPILHYNISENYIRNFNYITKSKNLSSFITSIKQFCFNTLYNTYIHA